MSAQSPDGESTGGGRGPLSPALIATMITVPVMVIAAFIAVAAMKNRQVPSTPVESYATVSAGAQECGPLIAKLPDSFGDYGDKAVDGQVVRWTRTDGTSREPLVLHCGVARPEALAPTSALQVINPVQWFITDTDTARGQAYVVVDRRPYVAVWVPVGAGNGPLTDISALVADLPAGPLDFGN